jgi:hypothetical protein
MIEISSSTPGPNNGPGRQISEWPFLKILVYSLRSLRLKKSYGCEKEIMSVSSDHRVKTHQAIK